jgi:hypothetical protein
MIRTIDMDRKAAAAVASLIVALSLSGCWAPPQIGPDRDTFKAVDALYTAISLRDPKLVENCASRLKELRAAGKVPEAAFLTLDSIILEASEGHWEPSQERLAVFMEGQER